MSASASPAPTPAPLSPVFIQTQSRGGILTGDGANQSVTNTGTCIDSAGNVAQPATVAGINIDKTPPTFACSATPGTLWPPDGRLAPIDVSLRLSDQGSGSAVYVLQSITSNEGSIATEEQGFIVGTPFATGMLRAERKGAGTGRMYTLTYQGSDHAGNTATCAVTVSVPHDRSN
jgi:hypothetical protein